MRTNTVAGVIFGLLMVLAVPSQAQEHEDIDCSELDAPDSTKELCEEMWGEEEIRVLIREEMNEKLRELEERIGIQECYMRQIPMGINDCHIPGTIK